MRPAIRSTYMIVSSLLHKTRVILQRMFSFGRKKSPNHRQPRQRAVPGRSVGSRLKQHIDGQFAVLRDEIDGIRRRQRRIRTILLLLSAFLVLAWFWKPIESYVIQPRPVAPTIVKLPTSQAGVASTGEQTPVNAIIFVHGLGGSRETTFFNKKSKRYWWDLFSADAEFNRYKLFAMNYGSNAFKESADFEGAVEVLKDYIDNNLKNSQRIVIIAHSLGGLIARMSLARCNVATNPTQQITLITLGTPFGGSDVANVGRNIGRLTSTAVELLESDNLVGRFARRDWLRLRNAVKDNRLNHFAGYEMNPTDGFIVVPRESATMDVPPSHQFGFPLNHFELVAPEYYGTPSHLIVRSWIVNQEIHKIQGNIPGKLEAGSKYILTEGEYNLTDELMIPPGVTFELSPGVTLKLAKPLVMEGRLNALGTPEKQVRIEFVGNKDNEGAIYFRGPHASDSLLKHCVIANGRGIGINKPDPSFDREIDFGSGSDWHVFIQRDSKNHRTGGGCLLVNADRVNFEGVRFENCAAYTGGACYLLGSARTQFTNCEFIGNYSTYGGGAVFLQQSEGTFTQTSFRRNLTGDVANAPPDMVKGEPMAKYACGGAVYAGQNSQTRFSGGLFSENSARYVGGGFYALNQDLVDYSPRHAAKHLTADISFVNNKSKGGPGAAIYVDDAVRMNVTTCTFTGNSAEYGLPPAQVRGISVIDNTSKFSSIPASFAVNGRNRIFQLVEAPKVLTTQIEGVVQSQDAAVAKKDTPQIDIARFYNSPIAIDCFKHPDQPRKITTIVLHHVSAIKWDKDEKLKAIKIDDSKMPGPPSGNISQYDWRRCKTIFEHYKVSSHYLITRDGDVIRFVADEDIASHAGESQMPPPDGRREVNNFSLGIELISTHPDDDPEVKTQSDAYTDLQYESLHLLLLHLIERYNISIDQIVGHEDVAPGRKKDPGPLFKMQDVKKRLRDVLRR